MNIICIVLFLAGVITLVLSQKIPLIAAGVLLLILYAISSDYIVCEEEKLHRLNPPITSEDQLYGYKVIKKEYSEVTSSSGESKRICFIIIKDVIPHSRISITSSSITVSASEEFYEKVSVGDMFFNEPNAL